MEKSAQFKMLHLLFQCKLILLSDSSLEIICTLIVKVLGNIKKNEAFCWVVINSVSVGCVYKVTNCYVSVCLYWAGWTVSFSVHYKGPVLKWCLLSIANAFGNL